MVLPKYEGTFQSFNGLPVLASVCSIAMVSGYYCLRGVHRGGRNELSHRYLLGQILDFGETSHLALAKAAVLFED